MDFVLCARPLDDHPGLSSRRPSKLVGSGVRVVLPTRDYKRDHDEQEAVVATIPYLNVRPEDYVYVLDVDHEAPPVNRLFRACRDLPAYLDSVLPIAMQLFRTGCWQAARRHLLRYQPPAWPRVANSHQMLVLTSWYRIVSGYPRAATLRHDSLDDHDRWLVLLTQHRSMPYETVLAALPCVICGSAESRTGDVIVYCDRGKYCRGTLAYHQMCVRPQLFQTDVVWNCSTCLDYRDNRRTADDTLSTADALLLKRQLFQPCWTARPLDVFVPNVDDGYPTDERVFQPSRYLGGGDFSTARYPLTASRLDPAFAGEGRRTLKVEADEARYIGEILDTERRRAGGCGSHTALASMRVALMTSNASRQLPLLPEEQHHLRPLWPDQCEHARPHEKLEEVHLAALVLDSTAPLTNDGGGVRIRPYPFVSLASLARVPSPPPDPDILPDEGFIQDDNLPLKVYSASGSSASGSSEAPVDIGTDGYVLNDYEQEEPDETIVCDVCGGGHSADGNAILLCDGKWLALDDQGVLRPTRPCCSAIHQYCCDPPLEQVPDYEWYCPNCDGHSPGSECTNETSYGTASEREETDYFDSSASSRADSADSPTAGDSVLPATDYRSGSDDEYTCDQQQDSADEQQDSADVPSDARARVLMDSSDEEDSIPLAKRRAIALLLQPSPELSAHEDSSDEEDSIPLAKRRAIAPLLQTLTPSPVPLPLGRGNEDVEVVRPPAKRARTLTVVEDDNSDSESEVGLDDPD